jgi:hypothetical protein
LRLDMTGGHGPLGRGLWPLAVVVSVDLIQGMTRNIQSPDVKSPRGGDLDQRTIPVTFASSPTWVDRSGLFAHGRSISNTYTDAGEFEYFCTPCPWMRVKVVVTG